MNAIRNLGAFVVIGCLLAACSGGGSDRSDAGSGTAPPQVTTTSFNRVVRDIVTVESLADTEPGSPLDINTQAWVFDEDEAAFSDLLE